jgi:hypothetical protein
MQCERAAARIEEKDFLIAVGACRSGGSQEYKRDGDGDGQSANATFRVFHGSAFHMVGSMFGPGILISGMQSGRTSFSSSFLILVCREMHEVVHDGES